MYTKLPSLSKTHLIPIYPKQTLKSALHMHLFDVLHGVWLSVQEISQQSPEHPPTRFLPELCDTLAAMNLIAKRTDDKGTGWWLLAVEIV